MAENDEDVIEAVVNDEVQEQEEEDGWMYADTDDICGDIVTLNELGCAACDYIIVDCCPSSCICCTPCDYKIDLKVTVVDCCTISCVDVFNALCYCHSYKHLLLLLPVLDPHQ